MKTKPFYAAATAARALPAVTAAAALLIALSQTGAAHAQNGGTGKNAPPRPDSTTPATAKPNFTFGSASKPGTIFAEVWEGKVVDVIDGVTLRIERRSRAAKDNAGDGGKPDSLLVRLWGVSLPANPTDAAAAKAYVEKSVKDKTVRVQVESKAANGEPTAEVFLLPDTPRYGVPVGRLRNASDPISVSQPRTIAEPDVPATFPNLNEGLLRAGLVRWNQTTAPKADGLSGAQEAAQKDKVGVWAVPGQK